MRAGMPGIRVHLWPRFTDRLMDRPNTTHRVWLGAWRGCSITVSIALQLTDSDRSVTGLRLVKLL